MEREKIRTAEGKERIKGVVDLTLLGLKYAGIGMTDEEKEGFTRKISDIIEKNAEQAYEFYDCEE